MWRGKYCQRSYDKLERMTELGQWYNKVTKAKESKQLAEEEASLLKTEIRMIEGEKQTLKQEVETPNAVIEHF